MKAAGSDSDGEDEWGIVDGRWQKLHQTPPPAPAPLQPPQQQHDASGVNAGVNVSARAALFEKSSSAGSASSSDKAALPAKPRRRPLPQRPPRPSDAKPALPAASATTAAARPVAPAKSRPPAPIAAAPPVTVAVAVAVPVPAPSAAPLMPAVPAREPPRRSRSADAHTLFKAKYAFSSRHPDELNFAAGDVLREMPRGQSQLSPEPGWFVAELLRSRRIGLCPLNYVERTAESVVAAASASAVRQPPVAAPLAATPHAARPVQAAPAPPPPPPPPPPPSPPALIARDEIMHSRSTPGSLASMASPAAPFNSTSASTASPVSKQRGFATDIIGVRAVPSTAEASTAASAKASADAFDEASDAQVFATDFNVRFTGASAKSAYRGDTVDVLIDGQVRFTMLLAEGGKCTFRSGALQCDSRTLGGVRGLLEGGPSAPHRVRYEHRFSYNGEYRLSFVEAWLWVWDRSDSLIVSDIDGTITKSDVGGIINGVLGAKLGWKKGYAHPGVCALYNSLLANTPRCRILYLTARPLNLINETRSYITELKQPVTATSMTMQTLPDGPVVSDTTNFTSSFRQEMVDKTSHVFKTQMLSQLRDCFGAAGRDLRRYPVFLATFGNKDTDARAYLAAGAPRATSFIIDTNSRIQVADEFRLRMKAYGDPRLLRMLQDRIDLLRTGRLPDPNFPITP